MLKKSNGRRAANTPPAVKQDASPAFTGLNNEPTQSRAFELMALIEIEEHYVQSVLALPPEEYERLSPAAKMLYHMHTDHLDMLKRELSAIEASQTGTGEVIIQ